MDVLLVNDFLSYSDMKAPHVGQLSIASVLSPEFHVAVINFNRLIDDGVLEELGPVEDYFEPFARYLISREPRIIGFYTICNTFDITIQLAERVHALSPDIRIVFGGPHASTVAEQCLHSFPFVYAIARGECELVIRDFVRAVIQGTSLDSIQNVTHRSEAGVVSNPTASLIPQGSLSDYTVFDLDDYAITSADTIPLEGGRGCPYACTFCSTSTFWGTRFRVKPADRLLFEMNQFHDRYGSTSFSILHDMFTARRSHVADFCRLLLENSTKFTWACSSRVDALDDTLLKLMQASGCESIYLGVETGSPRMQKVLNKNLDLQQVEQVVKSAQKLGIKVTTSFMFGFLGEQESDFLRTAELIERLYLLGVGTVQLHQFLPQPATPETQKVKDQLYFAGNESCSSASDDRMFGTESLRLIGTHREMFSNFYSFDTPVRQKYKYMMYFILALSESDEVLGCTNRILVRKYGLVELFLRHIDTYKAARVRLGKYRQLTDTANLRLTQVQMSVAAEEERVLADELLSAVFAYEALAYRYRSEQDIEPGIYEFPCDIEETIRSGKVSGAPRSYHFERVGDEVRVAQMDRVYDDLAALLERSSAQGSSMGVNG